MLILYNTNWYCRYKLTYINILQYIYIYISLLVCSVSIRLTDINRRRWCRRCMPLCHAVWWARLCHGSGSSENGQPIDTCHAACFHATCHWCGGTIGSYSSRVPLINPKRKSKVDGVTKRQRQTATAFRHWTLCIGQCFLKYVEGTT